MRPNMTDIRPAPVFGGESLLFLTDEQLRQGIEAMFFAYRGFTADPDRILAEKGYGRAHHRAIHFINRSPGTTACRRNWPSAVWPDRVGGERQGRDTSPGSLWGGPPGTTPP